VGAATAARRPEFADVAARAVQAIDRKDAPIELGAAAIRPCSNREKKYKQSDRGGGEASCAFCAASYRDR
jgi:hypothetical protein